MSKLSTFDKRKEQLTKTIEKATATLEKAQADLAKVTQDAAEAAAFAAINGAVEAGLPAGTIVTFNYGRAETKKELTGSVVGTKPQEKGSTLYRVRVGEGFDEQVFSITAAAILSHNYTANASVDIDPILGSGDPASDNR